MPFGHLGDVRAHFLRQLADFIDVADLQREECVGRVLDQFRRCQIGGDQGHRFEPVWTRQVRRRENDCSRIGR